MKTFLGNHAVMRIFDFCYETKWRHTNSEN